MEGRERTGSSDEAVGVLRQVIYRERCPILSHDVGFPGAWQCTNVLGKWKQIHWDPASTVLGGTSACKKRRGRLRMQQQNGKREAGVALELGGLFTS